MEEKIKQLENELKAINKKYSTLINELKEALNKVQTPLPLIGSSGEINPTQSEK